MILYLCERFQNSTKLTFLNDRLWLAVRSPVWIISFPNIWPPRNWSNPCPLAHLKSSRQVSQKVYFFSNRILFFSRFYRSLESRTSVRPCRSLSVEATSWFLKKRPDPFTMLSVSFAVWLRNGIHLLNSHLFDNFNLINVYNVVGSSLLEVEPPKQSWHTSYLNMHKDCPVSRPTVSGNLLAATNL